MKSLCRLHSRVKEIQQSIAVIEAICAGSEFSHLFEPVQPWFLRGLASSQPSGDGAIRSFCRERILE
jgi:hypothetical protein